MNKFKSKNCYITFVVFFLSYAVSYSQNIILSIQVKPDSSLVSLNGDIIGVTPFYKKQKFKFDEYLKHKLTILRKGYQDTSFWIDQTNLSQFDKSVGNVLQFDLKRIRKTVSAKVQKLPLAFDKMVVELTNGQKIGEITNGSYFKPFYWQESGISNATVEFNTIAETELSNAGYNTIRQGKLFAEEQSEFPKLLVGGSLKSLNYKSRFNLYQGSQNNCTMVIEWQIFSRIKNKVIFNYTTEGSYNRAGGESASNIRESFREAIINLTQLDTFVAIIEAQDANKVLDESINKEQIVIAKLPKAKFKSKAEMIAKSTESSVTIKCDVVHGSGFIISSDGFIITNQHVISKSKEILVIFDNGISIPAKLIYENEDYDLAIIKLSGKGFKPLRMGNSDSVTTGADVYAIGTPKDIDLGQTVTKGIISGKRTIENRVFLQTDASIHGGNSGGPLLNENGEVIGINSYGYKNAEGLNLAIPINVAIEKLNIQYK